MKKKLTLEEINAYNLKVVSRPLRGGKFIQYKNNLDITPVQNDILVGTLLGDASIRTSKCNFCVKFEQKYTQEAYLKHLYETFEPFVGTGPKMRVIRNSFHKDYGISCWFRTYSHIKFKYYENLFYQMDDQKKRRKTVPKNIHQILTPRALAYWFMDDGSYIFAKYGLAYCFNTQGFTFSEQKRLQKALKRNFNFDFDIKVDKDYYRLAIQEQSETSFYQLIKPYIIQSFKYKLEKKQLY